MPSIEFYKIRSLANGKAGGFEELCCQLFFREFNDKAYEFHRFRGEGGDGGVEALFILEDGSKIAIQSKYWDLNKFNSPQITQLNKSISAAISNHPEIKKYYSIIFFDCTYWLTIRSCNN